LSAGRPSGDMDRVAREACDPVDSILRKGRGGRGNGEQQCHSGDEAEFPSLPCHDLDHGAQIHGTSAKLLAPGPGVISAGHWCEPNDTCGGRVTVILRLVSSWMIA